ncbi:hypothetical protein G7046_g5045 [Stylonectria norvegica]|nr:hypothetical protein G7046_g5045 [Stylonectria norvegica]
MSRWRLIKLRELHLSGKVEMDDGGMTFPSSAETWLCSSLPPSSLPSTLGKRSFSHATTTTCTTHISQIKRLILVGDTKRQEESCFHFTSDRRRVADLDLIPAREDPSTNATTMAIAAVGQICATASIKGNLDQCVRLVAKAAMGGAKRIRLYHVSDPPELAPSTVLAVSSPAALVHTVYMDSKLTPSQILFLPEAADYIAASGPASLDLAVPQSTSPFVLGLQAAAREHSVAVHVGIHHPLDGSGADAEAGTEPGATPPPRKLLNRALYITPSGTIDDAATYDKLHVFDYGALRESATVQPGSRLTPPFDSPVGRIGSLICFDLRFAETAVALAQPGPHSAWAARPAQILTYPSAFTLRTGAAHWETLLRARAVETQSWVVAAAQVGRHNDRRASYGRSLVVDPWGRVVLRLRGVVDDEGDAEDGAVGEIGFVDVDLDEWARVRGEMPLQRRL